MTALTRRGLMRTLTGLFVAGPVLGAAEGTPTGERGPALRRVVTTRDAAGRNAVLADGAPPVSLEMNGTRITRLWETGSVPAPLPVSGDASLQAGSAYRPGFIGTSFYVAEIPAGVGRRQIPFHRNTTIDYMAILDGEIVFVLPDQEILLRQGDTLVQCGNDHTWENRSDRTCRLLFVVVPATLADSSAGG